MVNSIALSFVYHSDEDIISSANNKSQRQSHKGDDCHVTSWFPLPWWTQSNEGDDVDSNGDDLYEDDDGFKIKWAHHCSAHLCCNLREEKE